MGAHAIDQIIQSFITTPHNSVIAEALATAKQLSRIFAEIESVISELDFASGGKAISVTKATRAALKLHEVNAISACQLLVGATHPRPINLVDAATAHARLFEICSTLTKVDAVLEQNSIAHMSPEQTLDRVLTVLRGITTSDSEFKNNTGTNPNPHPLPRWLRIPLALSLFHFALAVPLYMIVGFLLPFVQIFLTHKGEGLPNIFNSIFLLLSLTLTFPLGLFNLHRYEAVWVVTFDGLWWLPVASLTFGIGAYLLGRYLLHSRMARSDLIFLTIAATILALTGDLIALMSHAEGIRSLDGFRLGVVLITQLPPLYPKLSV